MGNYEQLKEAIKAVIKTNDKQEITGQVMQDILLTITSSFGQGALFAGIATPETNPLTPDQNVFYLASQSGVYPNFNSLSVNKGEIVVFSLSNGQWSKQILSLGGGGSVTTINEPDEEDLTTVLQSAEKNVIRFKNRIYDEANASGKGYKILRKYWKEVNGVRKNILTQDMINDPNTVYEIRYDFDLNKAEIQIKEGCVLNFVGGSLKNGTLIGNNTEITNGKNNQIFDNVYFGSSDLTYDFINVGRFVINGIINAKWFGLLPDVENNQQDKFEQISSLICCVQNVKLSFDKGLYKFGKQDSINQRLYDNTPPNLILFIGHALLRVTGNVINNILIEGNGCIFEDIFNHKQGWFNSDGTPDYIGQIGGQYTEKKFAHCGTGILFKKANNLKYISLSNLSINLNSQQYQYGGAIGPSPLSYGISVEESPNATVIIRFVNVENCITDGIYTNRTQITDLGNVALKNNERTGFASESGGKFILKHCNIYKDNYYKPTLPPGAAGNIYKFERPYADLNIECLRDGTSADDVCIQFCKFGDCSNVDYQLALQGNIKNAKILDCIFHRTKAINNGAYTISISGDVLLNNIQFFNSKYTTPSVNRKGNVIVDNIYINAMKWDTMNEDYNPSSPFVLTSFASGQTAIVENITVNLLDKFSLGPINVQIAKEQRINKLAVNILEELTRNDSVYEVGQLPSISYFVINDFVTKHTIEYNDRPTFKNLDNVKELIYNKIDGSNERTIKFIDSTYKADIKWVDGTRYTPITSNMIKMYNGVYSVSGNLIPDCIYLSCLTEKATFTSLPNYSLSYKVANHDADICRLWIWNSDKNEFVTYVGLPRKLNKLHFINKETFDSFCVTNAITTLFAGERVMIGNKQYFAKGTSLDLLTHDGISINVKNSGTFAEKPLTDTIPIGYSYFCIDKQTVEGGSNGMVIYYKGNNVWVDALGRVVE